MLNRLMKIVVKTASNNNEINSALKKLLPRDLVALLILFAFIGFGMSLILISIKTKNSKTKRFISEVKKAEQFFVVATLIFVVFAAATTIIGALVH